MKERYEQVITGNGDVIFVRVRDMTALKNAMLENPVNPKHVVAQSLSVLINSPEGLTKMSKSLGIVRDIQGIEDVDLLKSLRRIIDIQIRSAMHKNRSKTKVNR